MIYRFNPLIDRRWPLFVDRHPHSSVFHSREWLEALQRTYGYEPIVYSTCSPSADITDGVVFCQIHSWLTGRRLVSLPFADHCDALVDDSADCAHLASAMKQSIGIKSSEHPPQKYVEIRPSHSEPWATLGLTQTEKFALHTLDLRSPIDEIYRRAHKNTFQRKVQRAERERVSCEFGNSERMINSFYGLMVLTRKRHCLPPQPIEWFQNLAATMTRRLTVWIASKGNVPVAALLMLSWRRTMVYKYGCSDARYHHLGAVPFLFWKAIQRAKTLGIETFDLGRSDLENSGLITFKNRLGAVESDLMYLRFGATQRVHTARNALSHAARQLCRRMPDRLLIATGKLLYRHIG